MEIGEDLPMFSYDHSLKYRLEHVNFGHSSISRLGNLAVWLRDICPASGITWNYVKGSQTSDDFKILKAMIDELQRPRRPLEKDVRSDVDGLRNIIDKQREEIEALRRENASLLSK
jgi:hypothetical protein